jgi:phosphatidylglycerophosphate synthase
MTAVDIVIFSPEGEFQLYSPLQPQVHHITMANQFLRLQKLFGTYFAEKYSEEVRTDWGSAVVYRPPALILTWLLSATSIKPTTVTAIAALLLPAMVFAAVLCQPVDALAAVLVMAALFQVLDCTDGSLARATGRVSVSGHYWDLLTDLAYRGVTYTVVGYLADQISPWPLAFNQATALALAAWGAAIARLARYNLDRLAPPPTPSPQGTSSFNFFSFLSGLDTLFPFIVAIAWAMDAIPFCVAWIALYSIGDVAMSIIDARKRLNALEA